MIKLQGYECEHCGELYSNKVKCAGHELRHILKDRFELTKMSWYNHVDTSYFNFDNRVGIFPEILIAENKEFSGEAAKYKLIEVASVEDIYTIDDE